MKKNTSFLSHIIFLIVGFVVGMLIPVSPLSLEAPRRPNPVHEGHMAHNVEVSDEENIPSIKLEAFADPDGGINVHAVTEHFTFAPEEANKHHRFGFGHGHIFINGERFSRLYNPWTYLPYHVLSARENTICVTLSTNSHGDYTLNGEIIESCVTVEE